jgi:hypothetical protein
LVNGRLRGAEREHAASVILTLAIGEIMICWRNVVPVWRARELLVGWVAWSQIIWGIDQTDLTAPHVLDSHNDTPFLLYSTFHREKSVSESWNFSTKQRNWTGLSDHMSLVRNQGHITCHGFGLKHHIIITCQGLSTKIKAFNASNCWSI